MTLGIVLPVHALTAALRLWQRWSPLRASISSALRISSVTDTGAVEALRPGKGGTVPAPEEYSDEVRERVVRTVFGIREPTGQRTSMPSAQQYRTREAPTVNTVLVTTLGMPVALPASIAVNAFP